MKQLKSLTVFLSLATIAGLAVHCGGEAPEVDGVEIREDDTSTELSYRGGRRDDDRAGFGEHRKHRHRGPKWRDDACDVTVYGVDDDNRLVRFDGSEPEDVDVIGRITGLKPREQIVGIDFRPANGKLYAVGTSNTIYTIDTRTACATAVTGSGPVVPFVLDPAAESFGVDFNPVADRLRVHSNTTQNLRLNPNDGNNTSPTSDAPLAFTAGDVHFGVKPEIVGSAYTNSVSPAPTSTLLYGIDTNLDVLVTFDGNPNDGKLKTIGRLGLDAEWIAGFDIRGGRGGGGDAGVAVDEPLEAFAALTPCGDGKPGLYRIDLATGKATRLGRIGHRDDLRGIAVEL